MKNNAKLADNTPIRIPGSELPDPVISYLEERDLWRLDEPYVLTRDDYRIRIPAGFEFDLASVPRPLWWLMAPFDLSIVAPLIHDFLYDYAGDPPDGTVMPPRTFTRAQADQLFLDLMRLEGVAAWRRKLAYWAVRLLGSFRWGD